MKPQLAPPAVRWTAAECRQRSKQPGFSCGINKQLTVHSLRLAYATHLLELCVDLRSIQDVLGHQKQETTARYAHLTEVDRQQAMDRIEDLVAGFLLRWEDV